MVTALQTAGCGRPPNPLGLDAAYCLNLDRRPDRWRGFAARVESLRVWPLCRVQRFSAVDGRRPPSPPPDWFTAGPGAWGCLLSHRAAIRAALDAGHERFAVFEDDCGFDRLFSSRVSALARALPRGAGTVALGGDHPRPPEPAGRGVVMLRGLQRTHALAYLSPAAAERFLRVTDPRTAAPYGSNGHVDHTLNGAIRDGALTVHAPAAWLCYQAESRSDIDGKQYGDRRWTRHTRPAAARTLLLDGPDGPREAEAARLLNAGGYHRHAPDDLARYAVLPTGPKRAACVRQWMIRGRRAAETRGATLLGAVPGALTLAGDDHRQPRPGVVRV